MADAHEGSAGCALMWSAVMQSDGSWCVFFLVRLPIRYCMYS